MKILDACCGSRMFWFDKEHKDTLYMDKRVLSETLCDGRLLEINPDMEDLTNVPNLHQDTLRYGKLNVKELHERCQADIKTAGLPCQKTLAITHMNECGKIALSVRDTFKDDWEVKYFYFEVN